MKIFLSFILVLGVYSALHSQKIWTSGSDDPLMSNEFLFIDHKDSSLIVDYDLTTNKEYLTYLAWVYTVWIDYPGNYMTALPDPKYRELLFDPMHAHDPVTGVSFNQAEKYCEWRTDRYNENILIREGILASDPNQMGEENFNTAAYLTGQYIGLVNSWITDMESGTERSVLHSDYMLLPSFYIPSQNEIDFVSGLLKKHPVNIPKKPESPLDRWLEMIMNEMSYDSEADVDVNHPLYKYYLMSEKTKNKDGQIKPNAKKFIAELNKHDVPEIQINKLNILQNSEYYHKPGINYHGEEIRYSKFFKPGSRNPFLMSNWESLAIKDSIGRMPFIWIADEIDGSPVMLYRYDHKSDTQIVNNGFICAMNIPYRMYLKRKYNNVVKNQPFLYKE